MSRPEIAIQKRIIMEEKRNYVNRTQKDYSMSFKLNLVREIESGEISISEAKKNMVFKVMVPLGKG